MVNPVQKHSEQQDDLETVLSESDSVIEIITLEMIKRSAER